MENRIFVDGSFLRIDKNNRHLQFVWSASLAQKRDGFSLPNAAYLVNRFAFGDRHPRGFGVARSLPTASAPLWGHRPLQPASGPQVPAPRGELERRVRRVRRPAGCESFSPFSSGCVQRDHLSSSSRRADTLSTRFDSKVEVTLKPFFFPHPGDPKHPTGAPEPEFVISKRHGTCRDLSLESPFLRSSRLVPGTLGGT